MSETGQDDRRDVGGTFQGRLPLLGAILAFALASCASLSADNRSLPPIIAKQELTRPYVQVGVVEASRERFYNVADLTPADYEWAYQALREEAREIGADAVIMPEVRVQVSTYTFFPSSEISAMGIAIKFR